MPANSDHVRRDAEHAARMEISIIVGKFIRRMQEDAKAHIAEAIAAAEGGYIDGTAIGREAVATASSSYLGDGQPREAIDTKSKRSLTD